MVFGYDEPRPTKENYSKFLEDLISGLRPLAEKSSLMIYGSYVRGDCNYGRSDIDGFVFLDDNVVIDKGHLKFVGEVFCDSLERNKVPIQFNVVDSRTMKGGIFNSYTPDFETYFQEEGRFLLGENRLGEFAYKMPKYPSLIPLNFNFRKSRAGLMLAEYNSRNNYVRFLEQFEKSLQAVSRGSKQVIQLMDDVVRPNRFSAIAELPKIFPEIDISPLRRIRKLFTNNDMMDRLYRDEEGVMEIWTESVTFFEEVIRSYLDWKERIPPRGE